MTHMIIDYLLSIGALDLYRKKPVLDQMDLDSGLQLEVELELQEEQISFDIREK